ncbi:hypothetical protein FWK35_00028954 [Aphis craccivora]|uniref:Uncharacterized protein n=1 Tax=Aphis craccivora TaxID=307492 RepID=A0A6G0YMU2_APHCR|nr:hypothetical protein FWK35_00022143 [Aphis craccivora]KAF0758570.1 hypothetical protein FWK35_00026206 [Aphis craccivora]KAF0766899.1 hypothetical protein FWK35_00028954 [Aphis craccivora]
MVVIQKLITANT